jgi:hypothetical protein
MIHLINLLGSSDAHWRDTQAERPDAPLLQKLKVRISIDEDIARAGWASPDVDGGTFHPLAITHGDDKGERYVELGHDCSRSSDRALARWMVPLGSSCLH